MLPPPQAAGGFNLEVAGLLRSGWRPDVVLTSERADALYISADPIFYSYRNEIASLAACHGIPAISGDRDFAQAGGLSSYGASRSDAYRQAGLYVGRILKGEKPSDLPVVQPTRFELLINLKLQKVWVLLSARPSLQALTISLSRCRVCSGQESRGLR
jgi:ABC-type uncharacterized transport system substrate-binding protein